MIFGDYWIYIVLIALIIDIIIGEFPTKHPVEFIGDYINFFERKVYKNTVTQGVILLASLLLMVAALVILLQFVLPKLFALLGIPKLIFVFTLGVLASTGLASKCLKIHINKVIYANESDKRNDLSLLVTRNTKDLDNNQVYGSLIETHSENLSDGFIAPLFYLVLFGLPGIILYKTVQTLDSMVGYKNKRYYRFGKASAILDDILNFIPARITALLIWLVAGNKVSWRLIFKDAPKYSSSPNAGYPVAAAAHGVGVKLGGVFYYGDLEVKKAEIGKAKTDNYKNAALDFIKIHSMLEKVILLFFIIILMILYII